MQLRRSDPRILRLFDPSTLVQEQEPEPPLRLAAKPRNLMARVIALQSIRHPVSVTAKRQCIPEASYSLA